MRTHATTRWTEKYLLETNSDNINSLNHDLPMGHVIHIIILPNFCEDLDTLCETLDVLASHDSAMTNYRVNKKESMKNINYKLH